MVTCDGTGASHDPITANFCIRLCRIESNTVGDARWSAA